MEGGEKTRHMAASFLHFEKYEIPLPQTSVDIALVLHSQGGDLLPQVNAKQGDKRSDPCCLRKGRPVPASQMGHAARSLEVPEPE